MINIPKKTIIIAVVATIAAIAIIIGAVFLYNKISSDNSTKQKHQQYIEEVHQENFDNENSRYDQ